MSIQPGVLGSICAGGYEWNWVSQAYKVSIPLGSSVAVTRCLGPTAGRYEWSCEGESVRVLGSNCAGRAELGLRSVGMSEYTAWGAWVQLCRSV